MARRMASELVPGTDVGQNHEGDNLTDLYLDHVLIAVRDLEAAGRGMRGSRAALSSGIRVGDARAGEGN